MPLGNMRANSVHSLAVWCLGRGCNHHSILDVSRCRHSARACAVSGAAMPVPCGLTTVYPLIDRTCSRVNP
jgi:hypothetical protein